MRLNDPVPGRQLLVASTGGHLAQLAKWAPRIGADRDSLWVTFESPQSDSLLQGLRVLHVPYVAPRAFKQAVKSFAFLMREIDWQAEAFTSAVTTGAAVGLAGLGAARLHGIPSFYFESVSRVKGPSLTGKLVGLDPWIRKSCQYEHWASGRWKYRGSLFDAYQATGKPPSLRPRLFVTLGTIQPYRFDSLVDAVLSSGLANETTVWQLGVTSRTDLPGVAVSQLSHGEFEHYAQDSDVVITHSGVGTLMELLDMGVYPVVVPRRAKRTEHVDDHQLQVASVLHGAGVSEVVEVEDLNANTILAASGKAVMRKTPGMRTDLGPIR